jgi:hypothetical protein
MKRDFTVTEAIERYPILQRVYQHFQDHRILTDEDFEKICKGETQSQARRYLVVVFGGEAEFFDNTDITP